MRIRLWLEHLSNPLNVMSRLIDLALLYDSTWRRIFRRPKDPPLTVEQAVQAIRIKRLREKRRQLYQKIKEYREKQER